jgi:hypothetical protein
MPKILCGSPFYVFGRVFTFYSFVQATPQAADGASVNGLFRSSVRSTIDYGRQRYTSAANFVGEITGKGSPNGSVYAGNGSVYFRTDASGLGHSPCYKTGGISNTANTAS